MNTSLQRLLPLFERERARARPVVLATVTHTAGPTYSKPGAQMLIAQSGEYAGLLSGGCLEGDLSERAARVFASGRSEVVQYDMRGPEDLLFGLGSGCEGAMDILLQRLEGQGDWQPLARQAEAWRAGRAERLLLVVRSSDAFPGAGGAGIFTSDGAVFGALPSGWDQELCRLAGVIQARPANRLMAHAFADTDIMLLDQAAPPRMLLLGAGPDALPVLQFATLLGWRLTVIDHRPHYAQAVRFPDAESVLEGGPEALVNLLAAVPTGYFSAAIVMSHHLLSDLGYLRALAVSDIGYVGLLGPASRRDRLVADMGITVASRLEPRLHAPVGLDLGPGSPESIALSIVAEVHANLAGRASVVPLSTAQGCAQSAEAIRLTARGRTVS